MKIRITILSVFFLTILLLDGRNNMIIRDCMVHHIIPAETNTDSETPDHTMSSLWDDIRWIDADEDKQEFFSPHTSKSLSDCKQKTIDFSGFVWQPPKFL